MKIFKAKKKLYRSLLLIFLAYFIVSSFVSTFARIGEYNNQIDNLNEQIAEEKAINNELKQVRSQVHSDENYKEIARDTLGLVDPGDKVYVNANDNNGK